jgi:hypothetical protein
MTIIIESTGDVKINGRKIAKLCNDGALCDIRRHSGGFRVAVSEELLESLADTTGLQFTNLDTKDVYTISGTMPALSTIQGMSFNVLVRL